MIIQELVLHNFGVYRGRQKVNLAPDGPDRSVVLLGGLNGEGKTTLLEAIQLALYGNRAKGSGRESLAYDDYLRSLIHRDVPHRQGAGLELAFTIFTEGTENTLRVQRTWRGTERSVVEKVTVLRNGEPDTVLTEVWNEYVEEFFPREISHLFFFDGERIEALADPAQASALIETAIHSLLGVDLIERLTADLVTLERRQSSKAESPNHEKLDQLQAQLQATTEERAQLIQERASLKNLHDRKGQELAEVESRFRKEGGELYERQIELETQRDEQLRILSSIDDELRELASTTLPLLLVGRELAAIEVQGHRELEARISAPINAALDAHDQAILAWAEESSGELATDLSRKLNELKALRESKPDVSSHIDLSQKALAELTLLQAETLPHARRQGERLLQQRDFVSEALTNQERRLNSIPPESSIKPLAEERNALRSELEDVQVAIKAQDSLIARADTAVEGCRQAIVRHLEKEAETELESDSIERTLTYARQSRETLQAFKQEVIENDLHQIETAVTESFRTLMRKETLVDRVEFSSPDYRVVLRNGLGREIRSEELSAGERQLLAVAMLWGLASVSGKSLPTIIDTPLGRLDSVHRGRLATRYFPFASHQVILLSTDEEVDSELFTVLQPHLARTYRLDYDDSTQSTRVVDGYFDFKELSHAR